MSQVTISDLKFVKPSTVRSWFDKGSKFAVVDVRESDYAGGHIKGCIHIPAHDFPSRIMDIRMRLEENKVQDVVFHCALSQVRGPKSALLFLRTIENDPPQSRPGFEKLNVYVLEGGFTNWARQYGEDKTVTEDFNAEIWLE